MHSVFYAFLGLYHVIVASVSRANFRLSRALGQFFFYKVFILQFQY